MPSLIFFFSLLLLFPVQLPKFQINRRLRSNLVGSPYCKRVHTLWIFVKRKSTVEITAVRNTLLYMYTFFLFSVVESWRLNPLWTFVWGRGRWYSHRYAFCFLSVCLKSKIQVVTPPTWDLWSPLSTNLLFQWSNNDSKSLLNIGNYWFILSLIWAVLVVLSTLLLKTMHANAT